MDNDNFILMAQLITGISESYADLEKSYATGDKRRFDKAKSTILDFQNKLDKLLS
jgi:hypothetical protein